jgi:uncharacterized OB-fold protein
VSEAPSVVYRRGLEEGTLRYQRCEACDRAVFFPRVLCPHCGSTELGWRTSRGTGELYSFTVVRSRDTQNHVGLIDLDEGFRMMCRLAPVEWAIGERVRAVVPAGTTIESLVFEKETAHG